MDSALLPGSHFKEKHLLEPETTFYWNRVHEREFTFQDKSLLIYCNNMAGLIKSLSLEYDATEWRLFLTLPAEVSKQLFYIMGIVFHLFLLDTQ